MEADDIFLDTKLRLKLKMADSCKEQNNYTLTLRILKDTHSVSEDYSFNRILSQK